MSGREVDTIAALGTPAGTGGIGVVRVSGPGAAEILGRPPRSFASYAREHAHHW